MKELTLPVGGLPTAMNVPLTVALNVTEVPKLTASAEVVNVVVVVALPIVTVALAVLPAMVRVPANLTVKMCVPTANGFLMTIVATSSPPSIRSLPFPRTSPVVVSRKITGRRVVSVPLVGVIVACKVTAWPNAGVFVRNAQV